MIPSTRLTELIIPDSPTHDNQSTKPGLFSKPAKGFTVSSPFSRFSLVLKQDFRTRARGFDSNQFLTGFLRPPDCKTGP
jgi:hypothetical protein